MFKLRIFSVLFLLVSGCQSFQPHYEIDEHVLIDKIWSVKDKHFTERTQLEKNLLSANIILLGETHDNALHHQLQSEIIDYLLQQGRRPALAFEMLDRRQQQTIDQLQQHSSGNIDVDNFARGIQWQESGWPDWPYYRPVFKVSLEAGLPVLGANLNRKLIRQFIMKGPDILEPRYQWLLEQNQFDAKTREKIANDIFIAHCEMLPPQHIDSMVMAQQLRDISMSQILLEHQTDDGVVLIAGSGHVRKDQGVPYYLAQNGKKNRIKEKDETATFVSLAFIEVQHESSNIEDYAEAWGREQLPFDYVWFTPRGSRDDQCEVIKQHMKKKQQGISQSK